MIDLKNVPSYMSQYFLVDGNNIANAIKDKNGKFKVENIKSVYRYLTEDLHVEKSKIFIFIDETTPCYVDDKEAFLNLETETQLSICPRNMSSLGFLLSLALQLEYCFIITNAPYEQYLIELENPFWIKCRIVKYLLVDRFIILCPEMSCDDLKQLFRSWINKNAEIDNNLNNLDKNAVIKT